MSVAPNLSFIAAIALIGAVTACSGESGGASGSDTELSEKTQNVETNATSSANPAPNASDQTQKADGLPDEFASNAFVIVILGDSLTAGFRLNDQDAPPAQIERRLRKDGIAVRVINAAVSGDTTAGGLSRFDWSVTSAEPDLLVIALGANDYLNNVAPDRAKENLEAIITRAKNASIPVALIGIEPRSSADADALGAAYGALYPELAAAHETPFYPAMLKGVRDNPSLLQADGLHPTAEGAGVIADNLTAFLTPIIVGHEE